MYRFLTSLIIITLFSFTFTSNASASRWVFVNELRSTMRWDGTEYVCKTPTQKVKITQNNMLEEVRKYGFQSLGELCKAYDEIKQESDIIGKSFANQDVKIGRGLRVALTKSFLENYLGPLYGKVKYRFSASDIGNFIGRCSNNEFKTVRAIGLAYAITKANSLWKSIQRKSIQNNEDEEDVVWPTAVKAAKLALVAVEGKVAGSRPLAVKIHRSMGSFFFEEEAYEIALSVLQPVKGFTILIDETIKLIHRKLFWKFLWDKQCIKATHHALEYMNVKTVPHEIQFLLEIGPAVTHANSPETKKLALKVFYGTTFYFLQNKAPNNALIQSNNLDGVDDQELKIRNLYYKNVSLSLEKIDYKAAAEYLAKVYFLGEKSD